MGTMVRPGADSAAVDIPEPPVVVNVTHVRALGTETLLYGTREDGSPVLVTADPGMAADVTRRLAAGEGPVPVTVERWQVARWRGA